MGVGLIALGLYIIFDPPDLNAELSRQADAEASEGLPRPTPVLLETLAGALTAVNEYRINTERYIGNLLGNAGPPDPHGEHAKAGWTSDTAMAFLATELATMDVDWDNLVLPSADELISNAVHTADMLRMMPQGSPSDPDFVLREQLRGPFLATMLRTQEELFRSAASTAGASTGRDLVDTVVLELQQWSTGSGVPT